MQQDHSSEKTVYSTITNFSQYGGAEKILVDIHRGIKNEFTAKILGFQDFKDIHVKYNIKENEFIKFRNPFVLKNSILLVHARNLLPFFIFLNRILFLNLRIIYVSHSVYSTHRRLTWFPPEIVSISSGVSHNLINYFKIKPNNISIIHNGINDLYSPQVNFSYKENGIIKILYIARIDKWKQQCEIVKNLKGKIPKNIEIHFAGIGDEYEQLDQLCRESENFKALGFVEDINSLIKSYDYIMLYSLKEGLPVSLMEGIMHAKPIITNNVGGTLEMCINNYNGIVLEEDWEDIIYKVNNLNTITINQYENMCKSSRELFLKKFRYELMIEKYVNLVRKNYTK